MQQAQEPTEPGYPHGRGYGHDYMRGGEVLGGYGYSARAEYETPRGELLTTGEHEHVGPSDELSTNSAVP
ncbi:MAG TPA: hypothetical protein VL308_06480 [Gemmatimonadaceae bacterium]|jgi:hypothetical protein|nr:hypothetical protein [Gemmatimonadaceae bacterium]